MPRNLTSTKRVFSRALCYTALALLLHLSVSATLWAEGKTWHLRYVAIEDPVVLQMAGEMLADAKALLGEPTIPIRKVHLRQSTPIDPDSNLKRGFKITELVDTEKGEFAIYLTKKPDDYSFHGQFAHEVAHLLNARLRDAYVEGLNTLFSEVFLRKKGLDWSGWERHYRAGRDPLYAATYFMMKEIYSLVGPAHIKTILSFAIWSNEEKTRMHIDINAWLTSLPARQAKLAREAIQRHAPAVKQSLAGTNSRTKFVEPE